MKGIEYSVKKRIRILAEMLMLTINYNGDDSLVLCSTESNLIVEKIVNDQLKVTCDLIDKSEIILKCDYIFDLIAEVFISRRSETQLKSGKPLSLADWIEEEQGDLQEIQQKVKELQECQVNSYSFGGNHYFLDYYKGYFHIYDDFGAATSNFIKAVL